MLESNRQVPYLDHVANTQIAMTAREGRRAALKFISRYCMLVSKDGVETSEVTMDRPMNLSELAKLVGEDAMIVGVSMRCQARTPRTKLLLLAAE